MRILACLLALASLPALAQAPSPATGNAGVSSQPQSQVEQQRPATPRAESRLQAEVTHALNMLPNYSIFDILNYQLQGSTVILSGKVRSQGLKGAAENAVRQVEGVDQVVNNIQVLPASGMDDQLRITVARTIFNTPGLTPYAMGAVPPIHIIVENGNVTLEGIVNSEGDKNLAGMKVKTIPGVLSVTNDLRVEK